MDERYDNESQGDGLIGGQLRFYAKADLLVSYPQTMLMRGNPAKYVGREYSDRTYVASKYPACFDPGTKEAERVLKILRTESPTPLWAADIATAKACGIPFIMIDFKDGEWLPSNQ